MTQVSLPLAPRSSLLTGVALTALLAAAPSAAFAEDPPPPPVVNGTATSSYPAVGMLAACDSRGYCSDFCSSTLLTSTWAVTAAHCVEAADDYARYGYDVWIVFGKDWDNVTDYAVLADWIEHPDYSSRTLEADIGLVELDTAITSITPMPPNRESPGTFTVSSLRYVGYGITSDRASDSGTKRYADIPLYDYDSQFIVAYDPAGRVNVCSGDSGGAGLEAQSTGGWELAAVNSYVTPGCVGGATGGTRVDAFLSWIEGYTGSLEAGSGTDGGSTDGGTTDGGGTDGGTTDGGGTDGGGTDGGGTDGGGTDGGSADGGGSDGGGDGADGADGTADGGSVDEVPDGSEEGGVGSTWGTTEADAGGAKAGCSTAGGGAAPVALLAWIGALAAFRRRED